MAIVEGEGCGDGLFGCGVGCVVDGVVDCCVYCVGYFCLVAGVGGSGGGGHCVSRVLVCCFVSGSYFNVRVGVRQDVHGVRETQEMREIQNMQEMRDMQEMQKARNAQVDHLSTSHTAAPYT